MEVGGGQGGGEEGEGGTGKGKREKEKLLRKGLARGEACAE